MRADLVTTGAPFLLLTLAHIVRVFQETHLAREPCGEVRPGDAIEVELPAPPHYRLEVV